jgi:hypothetical protein
MMRYHGARMTMGKIDSVTKLIKVLDYYKGKDISVVASAILREQDHLKSILPGRSSVFYDSNTKKLDEILGKCNDLIYTAK